GTDERHLPTSGREDRPGPVHLQHRVLLGRAHRGAERARGQRPPLPGARPAVRDGRRRLQPPGHARCRLRSHTADGPPRRLLRHVGDGIVRSVPSGEQIAALEHDVPGTTVRVTAIPGEQLSRRHAEDAYSSVLATVYIGGRDEQEITAAYRRCLQTLAFEIDE